MLAAAAPVDFAVGPADTAEAEMVWIGDWMWPVVGVAVAATATEVDFGRDFDSLDRKAGPVREDLQGSQGAASWLVAVAAADTVELRTAAAVAACGWPDDEQA